MAVDLVGWAFADEVASTTVEQSNYLKALRLSGREILRGRLADITQLSKLASSFIACGQPIPDSGTVTSGQIVTSGPV